MSGAGWGAGVREAAPGGSQVRVPAPAHRCDELRGSQPAAGRGGTVELFSLPGMGETMAAQLHPRSRFLKNPGAMSSPPSASPRVWDQGGGVRTPHRPPPRKKRGKENKKEKYSLFHITTSSASVCRVRCPLPVPPPTSPLQSPPLPIAPWARQGARDGAPPALLAPSLGWEEAGRGCCLRFGVCSPPQTLSGQWGVR